MVEMFICARVWVRVGLIVCLASVVVVSPAQAQGADLQDGSEANRSAAQQVVQIPPAGPPPTPRHTGIKAMAKGLVTDVTHLPSRENLFWVGVGAAGALAVHPADQEVTSYLVDAPWAGKVFAVGSVVGELYVLLPVATTVYIVGRTKDEPKVSHVGMDLIRSVALAEGITQALKYTVRRTRPDGTPYSFPSGHAADTMAFATALERHLGWKGAVPAYLFASYVAASRLHDNRHYLSDVVFGSTVGIIAGRTVTRHGREQFPVAVVPVRGGAAVLMTRTSEN
jgi:membrane-associated phospholipid phosphatase